MREQGKSNVRWFLVFWLFILSAVSFLDRVNISVAASAIASEYRLSDVDLGWVFSAFLWGYAIFQTFGGWLADRFGPRQTLTVGVVWWGVFTALTAAVSPAIDRCGSFLCIRAIFVGSGRSDHLSRVQSICVAMDSDTGARNRKWTDFCRRWRGGRLRSGDRHLYHGALRVALVLLAERFARIGGGSGLVFDSARYTGKTFKGFRL